LRLDEKHQYIGGLHFAPQGNGAACRDNFARARRQTATATGCSVHVEAIELCQDNAKHQ
jgi:hypothetical protein